MKKNYSGLKCLIVFTFCFQTSGFAQIYDDFYGAGHNLGIITSSSSDNLEDTSENSVSGVINELTIIEASRFLSQAALGVSYEQIENLRDNDLNNGLKNRLPCPFRRLFRPK